MTIETIAIAVLAAIQGVVAALKQTGVSESDLRAGVQDAMIRISGIHAVEQDQLQREKEILDAIK